MHRSTEFLVHALSDFLTTILYGHLFILMLLVLCIKKRSAKQKRQTKSTPSMRDRPFKRPLKINDEINAEYKPHVDRVSIDTSFSSMNSNERLRVKDKVKKLLRREKCRRRASRKRYEQRQREQQRQIMRGKAPKKLDKSDSSSLRSADHQLEDAPKAPKENNPSITSKQSPSMVTSQAPSSPMICQAANAGLKKNKKPHDKDKNKELNTAEEVTRTEGQLPDKLAKKRAVKKLLLEPTQCTVTIDDDKTQDTSQKPAKNQKTRETEKSVEQMYTESQTTEGVAKSKVKPATGTSIDVKTPGATSLPPGGTSGAEPEKKNLLPKPDGTEQNNETKQRPS